MALARVVYRGTTAAQQPLPRARMASCRAAAARAPLLRNSEASGGGDGGGDGGGGDGGGDGGGNGGGGDGGGEGEPTVPKVGKEQGAGGG